MRFAKGAKHLNFPSPPRCGSFSNAASHGFSAFFKFDGLPRRLQGVSWEGIAFTLANQTLGFWNDLSAAQIPDLRIHLQQVRKRNFLSTSHPLDRRTRFLEHRETCPPTAKHTSIDQFYECCRHKSMLCECSQPAILPNVLGADEHEP